jgi:hypothetical protein
MGCCVSSKKTKVTLEASTALASSAQITTASPDKKKVEVPVAALLRELTDDFEEKSSSEASLVIQEVPAKPRSQSPALEVRPAVTIFTNQVKLPEVKSVSQANGFDKERYKTANKGALPSIFSLPLSVQEQLDEVEVRSRVNDPTTQPASSLALLSQKLPQKKEGSMEQYLAARTIIYS